MSDTEFLFITELEPSQAWLETTTLAPQGEITLDHLRKEVKCIAGVGKPFARAVEADQVLKESLGQGNPANSWKSMAFFQVDVNCFFLPSRGCTIREARLDVHLKSYDPARGASVVLDIAPRKIQHVKGKLAHKLGLAKLLPIAWEWSAAWETYEYALLGVFARGLSQFHWTFQQTRAAVIAGLPDDPLRAIVARPSNTRTFAHFDLMVEAVSHWGPVPLDTKRVQVTNVDYALC
jgi:hypothetical protein